MDNGRMLEEEREELSRLLDDLEAPEREDGAREVLLACGAKLAIFMPPDSPDLYAEAECASLPGDRDVVVLCRELSGLNFFWLGLDGFIVALRNDMLMVETREDLARMADEESLRSLVERADSAVRTVREIATAPVPRDDDDGGGSGKAVSEGALEVRI